MDHLKTLRNSTSSVHKPLKCSSYALQRMNSMFASENYNTDGFDDLRLCIKGGSDFSKELLHFLSERSELEANYSRGLLKLASKLFKACKETDGGSVGNAWHFIAEDAKISSEIHDALSSSLLEDFVKPLKKLSVSQSKTRKSFEGFLEKTSRSYNESLARSSRNKNKSYQNAKENERIQDAALDSKLGKGKVYSEKELGKLQAKRRKSQELSTKSERDYYFASLSSERCRLEWESGIGRGCFIFRELEEKRLVHLGNMAKQYQGLLLENRPKLLTSSERLEEPIQSLNIARDLEFIQKRIDVIDLDALGGEILLPSFYSEDLSNAMNKERRKNSLSEIRRVILHDIERERKGKEGLENLAQALLSTPTFGDTDSLQEIQDKCLHMTSLLTFLEASKIKVNSVLEGLEGQPRSSHPLMNYISVKRDKAGRMSKAVLEISSGRGTGDGSYTNSFSDYRTSGDGGLISSSSGVSEAGSSPLVADEENNEEDEDDDDFEDSDGFMASNEISEIYYQDKVFQVPSLEILSSATVLYDYDAKLYDELNLHVGDVIQVTEKQEDGWWVGMLDGTIGIFPATYVKEMP